MKTMKTGNRVVAVIDRLIFDDEYEEITDQKLNAGDEGVVTRGNENHRNEEFYYVEWDRYPGYPIEIITVHNDEVEVL